MRIYPSTVGLAAYVLGFVTADDEGPGLQMRAPSPVIDINTSEWVSPGIFSDDTHLQWTKSEGTKVLKAYIKNRAGNALASATATMSGGHSRQTSLAVAGRKRDSSSGQGAGTGGMTLEGILPSPGLASTDCLLGQAILMSE